MSYRRPIVRPGIVCRVFQFRILIQLVLTGTHRGLTGQSLVRAAPEIYDACAAASQSGLLVSRHLEAPHSSGSKSVSSVDLSVHRHIAPPAGTATRCRR